MEKQVDTKTEELSFKELIGIAMKWAKEMRQYWKQILLVAFLGGVLGIGYSMIKKKLYIGEVTFVLEDEKAGGLGGAYSGIASQFGVSLGDFQKGGAFSNDNIVYLMTSRLMVEKTLLTAVTIGSQKETLVDYFIGFNKLKEDWQGDPALKDMSFPVNYPREQFTLKQDSVLGLIYNEIVERNLEVNKVDKKLSIFSVKVKATNEVFAKFFSEELVNNVTRFYSETKTKKIRANLIKLERRTDSVKNELYASLYGRAMLSDQNRNIAFQQAALPIAKREGDVQIQKTLYEELVKNLELTKMSLMKEEPLMQIIDKPIFPLDKHRLGKMKAGALGALLSSILLLAFLSIRKMNI